LDLILAEKPVAAEKIEKTIGIKTVPAVGHLLELKNKSRSWIPPYFDLVWVPRKRTLPRLNTILRALEHTDSLYIATDYDPEGQLIALNILRFSGYPMNKVYRMKFSSLEKEELVKAYSNLLDFNENLALAAEVRHYLDWYFGKNISKTLTLIYNKYANQRKWMGLTPVGRVQSPTLSFLVDREREISSFLGKEIWFVKIHGLYDENQIFEITTLSLDNKEEMEDFVSYGRKGLVDAFWEHSYEIKTYPPNKDYVMEKCLAMKISSSVVDYILQDLYLNEYISYPRTSSTKYSTHGIDTQKYLERISEVIPLAKDALGKVPREGEIDDIHPAIYPIRPYLEKDLRRVVWEIIAEAFVKSHLPPEEHKHLSCEVIISNRHFTTREIPQLNVGDEFDVVYSEIHKGVTTPPDRYSQLKVYGWMVEKNIGTKDTRSQIISKLLKTYLFETKEGLYVSSKGMKIVDILNRFCRSLVNVDLTRKFESYVDQVMMGKMNVYSVLENGRKTVTEIINKLLNHEEEIARILVGEF